MVGLNCIVHLGMRRASIVNVSTRDIEEYSMVDGIVLVQKFSYNTSGVSNTW